MLRAPYHWQRFSYLAPSWVTFANYSVINYLSLPT